MYYFLSLYSRKVKWMVFALLEFSVFRNSWAHIQDSLASLCCLVVVLFTVSWSLTEELSHKRTGPSCHFLKTTAVLYRWTHVFHLPCRRKCVHVLFCRLWPIYPAFCFFITSVSMAGTHFRGARNQRHDANWSTLILMLNARL